MVGRWLEAHWKPMTSHSIILCAFVLFCIFLSGPIFEKFEVVDGECGMQNISLPDETGGVYYHIDRLLVGAHVTEVCGVAFVDGQSSEDSEIYLVLKSDDKCYVLDTMTQMRPDMTSAFTDLNLELDRSGFVCNIPSRKISSGQYVLGIYVKKSDTEALQYTDSVLLRTKTGLELEA